MTDNPAPTPESRLSPEIQAQLMAHLRVHLDRSTKRIKRVVSLVLLNMKNTSSPSESDDDVLRAAVVLLHATLEDLLRSIAGSHLPVAGESALNAVPLAGSGGVSRAEKFSLGRLVQHRGKTVDQVLQESVAEYLERSNFNNCVEVVALLENIGLEKNRVQHLLPKLDVLMKRRHQIVHRADLVQQTDGTEVAEGITSDQVTEWLQAVADFYAIVLGDLTAADIAAGRLMIRS